MVIENRKRMPGQGRTYVKTKKTIPINFDLASLNLMCNYVLSENRNIRRVQYINLRNLVSMLDMERYINDQERYKRILFVKKGLEARLVRGLNDPVLIMKYINGGIIDDDIIDMSEFTGLSNSGIDWVNETISNALAASFVYEECDRQLDLWTRFKASDYRSISSIVEEIKQSTVDLNNKFRRAEVTQSTDQIFSLKPETMSGIIADSWSEVTSKYRKLVTGMQGFNQLIGGGFENTRVYLFLGITGVGKSMTLIDLVYQLKKYNRGFKPKDPTKRPCIVYFTMENLVTETLQRLFKISTGEELSEQSSPEEAERKLIQEGELYLTDDSPVDIIIKFRPNKSEDTSYLYTLCEDLEDEGYEVICMAQDHAKRIRSTMGNPDVRLELGDVINEMKTFAMIKDIPLLTDSHLNRDGARVIDQNSTNSKADLTRMLGKSNIGESLLMLDNVDFASIINTEYDSDGNKYMVFKEIKSRINSLRDYICQPYLSDNPIKLVEDFYSPVPVFRESTYTKPILNTGRNSVETKKAQLEITHTGYGNIIPDDDDGIGNVYDVIGTNTYSSTSIPIIPDTEYIEPFTISA